MASGDHDRWAPTHSRRVRGAALLALPALLALGTCNHAAAPTGVLAAAATREGAAADLATWDRLRAPGTVGRDSPTAGEDAAVVLDAARHRLLLFGGKGDDDVNVNELWTFD